MVSGLPASSGQGDRPGLQDRSKVPECCYRSSSGRNIIEKSFG